MKNDRRTKTEILRDLNSLRKQIKRIEIDLKKKSIAADRIKKTHVWEEAVINGSRDGIVVTGIDAKIVTANASACTMTGYTQSSLRKKNIFDLYGGKDAGVFHRYFNRVIGGEAVLFYAKIRRHDGGIFEAEFNSRRIEIEGKPFIHSVIRDSSNRRQIERELTIYDNAMKSVSEAITITDEHNMIVFVNDTFLRMYGYEEEELIGSPISILRIEETLPPVHEILAATLDKGWQGELINRRKDGSTFPIWLSTSVVRDENGLPIGLIGITTDITERKRAEEALQKSEERYRDLINNQEEGIAIVDRHEYFTFVNPAGEKIFGVPPGTLVGRNLGEFSDSEQMKSVLAETQKRIRGIRSVYEHEIIRPDGEKRFLQITGTSHTDKDGNFIGTFGVFHDITELKKTERAKKIAEDALRASEEYFREVIENSSDIIIILDRRGTIRYVSPSVERFLGYKPHEMIGKNTFRFIHPADVARAIAVFSQAIQQQASVISNTFRIKHKDGTDRMLEGIGRNLLDHASIGGFLMNVHDVTEKWKAEAALRESRDQLRILTARLETVREQERKYIAREMHEEFGQVLSAIKLQMSDLSRKYSRDEAYVTGVKELLGFIDEAIHSVRKISTELRPGVLDLLGLTAAIEWQAKEFKKQFNIACNVDVPKESIPLQEKSSLILFRILQDALKNVVDHAQATHVHIRLRADAELVELLIEDNGIGVTEEQLKSPSSIGFVLMKERAISIGGSAEVQTSEEKGTIIKIQIPVHENSPII
jgi:PAS domain S-box-containing protein